MWGVMTSLTPTSTASEIEKVTQYFEPNAIAYLSGMTAPPSNGHKEIIAAATQLAQFWKMQELRVTSEVVSADGKLIMSAMENDLKILGKDVKGFYECQVVKFSEGGLIERYELYCDPASIMKIFQEAGVGGS